MDEKTGKPAKEKGLTFRFPSLSQSLPFVAIAAFLFSSSGSFEVTRAFEAESSFEARLSPPLKVERVIDGDTIELSSGTLVRYIGIDTPETRKKIGGRWIVIDEPFAEEAREFNRRLVEEKEVRLEFDQEMTDRFGRWLAYVFIEDESAGGVLFANEELVKAGLARVWIHPPNVRHSQTLFDGEKGAKAMRLGLWKGGDHGDE